MNYTRYSVSLGFEVFNMFLVANNQKFKCMFCAVRCLEALHERPLYLNFHSQKIQVFRFLGELLTWIIPFYLQTLHLWAPGHYAS